MTAGTALHSGPAAQIITRQGSIPVGDSAGVLREQTPGNPGDLLVPDSASGVLWATGFGGYRAGKYYETKGTATATRAYAADELYVVPVIIRSRVTIDRLGVEVAAVGTGSTVFRLGIWNTHTDGMPGTVALDAGTVDGVAAPGWLEKTGLTTTLAPGLYWFGAAGQTLTGSPTLRAASTQNVGWANVPSVGAASTSLGLNGSIKYTGISGAFASLAGVADAGGVQSGPVLAFRAA